MKNLGPNSGYWELYMALSVGALSCVYVYIYVSIEPLRSWQTISTVLIQLSDSDLYISQIVHTCLMDPNFCLTGILALRYCNETFLLNSPHPLHSHTHGHRH